jgi:hypothetical protein
MVVEEDSDPRVVVRSGGSNHDHRPSLSQEPGSPSPKEERSLSVDGPCPRE